MRLSSTLPSAERQNGKQRGTEEHVAAESRWWISKGWRQRFIFLQPAPSLYLTAIISLSLSLCSPPSTFLHLYLLPLFSPIAPLLVSTLFSVFWNECPRFSSSASHHYPTHEHNSEWECFALPLCPPPTFIMSLSFYSEPSSDRVFVWKHGSLLVCSLALRMFGVLGFLL